ncbi:MAG: putative porin [Bacteroidota bacterium]
MRYCKLLLWFFFLSAHALFAQIDSIPVKQIDTTEQLSGKQEKRGVEGKEITIANYKKISFDRDTTYVDTALTIQKEYRYNYLRQDDFELMPFSNIGQPYNSLGINFEEPHFYPRIGARGRHFAYLETEDIPYYNVATPLTELFFKTTLEQGQLLDAMLTFNTSERLNFSVAYTGFRSLGKYQFDQAEASRFRTTFNYRTKNNRYWMRGHYSAQDLDGEENGGLSNKEEQFESGDPDFLDRSRIDVVFENARNSVVGKRSFFEHQFNLVRPRKDSIKNRSTMVSIGHQFNYETRFYQFNQTAQNDVFGTEVLESPIDDKASLRTTFNQVSATFSNAKLGRLSGSLNFYHYDYSFRSILITQNETIPNQLEGDEIAVGGDYWNRIGRLTLKGKVRYNLSGDVTGSLLDASASYALNYNNSIDFGVYSSSRLPNFNFLLYQSDYENFNWFNLDTNGNMFEKEQIQSVRFGFDSKWLGHISAKYTALSNYAYFGLDEAAVSDAEAGLEEGQTIDNTLNAFVRPFQETNTINYLKLKYTKEFKWRKWALNNTVMYQEVSQDALVLNVPQVVTRNTLYFSSDVFKKAMFLQTGVTFKCFTAYNMNSYHPLLGEFYVQNREELGAFPLIDVFINARVRQTRIYFKAEHLNTIWAQEFNYYSAPNYPYRDFVIRFGLVWNFFS